MVKAEAALASACTDVSYHTLGLPSYECSNCHAIMWYEERSNKARKVVNPSFSLCCQNGRFRDQIRVYNSMFSFTSFGARIDHSINTGKGLYTFRINGQNYHRIGSLLPKEGVQPRFAQLWFFDTENEVRNRMGSFINNENGEGVDKTTVKSLLQMLDQYSAFAKTFRMARDWCPEVATLITNDFGDGIPTRDIIVNKQDSGPKRISELHPSYMSLQYPLLFPYGEDCFHDSIPYYSNSCVRKTNRGYVTMKEYYSYTIYHRKDQGTTLVRGGLLFQQYLVDAYTAIEEQRLKWTRNNQDTLRVDLYYNVCDAVTRGDTNAAGLGKTIVLLGTFIGGPRYMMQNYHDAIAICHTYGNPDMFITFTFNPKW
ncbi:helicase [Tanacetum coccineum]